jgi:hypothetical protein
LGTNRVDVVEVGFLEFAVGYRLATFERIDDVLCQSFIIAALFCPLRRLLIEVEVYAEFPEFWKFLVM